MSLSDSGQYISYYWLFKLKGQFPLRFLHCSVDRWVCYKNCEPSAKMWDSPKTCKHQTNHTTDMDFVHTIRAEVFHKSVHENHGLLGYDVMWFGKEVPALWRKLLPPLQGHACNLPMEAAGYSINVDTKHHILYINPMLGTTLSSGILFVFWKRPLFLCKFNQLLLHCKSLTPTHSIHVTTRSVSTVSLLTIVQILLLCARSPERISVNHL